MRKSRIIINTILLTICSFVTFSNIKAQSTEAKPEMTATDIQKARVLIENIDKKFSEAYRDVDSIAITSFYAKDGEMLTQHGAIKGGDLLSTWNRMIQGDSTRNLEFITTAFTGDNEYMVELGIYEMKDDNGIAKDKGNYVVVWKQESGTWKLYRDIGL